MRIISYPRIHIGLADLSNSTARNFGGAGLSVHGFKTKLEITKAKSLILSGFELLDNQANIDVKDIISSLIPPNSQQNIHLKLHEHPPQHSGFGSKTTLLSSVIKVIDEFYKLGLEKDEIQILSGRAGASGIGVHTFWEGGFIVDGGHCNIEQTEFLPSSSQKIHEIPPITFKHYWPNEWKIHLFLPLKGLTRSGEEENSFFRFNTPIPEIESLKTIATIYHGLVPALIERSFCVFKEAIENITFNGFKKIEISAQNPDIISLISALNKAPNLVAGMSSMGPLVYCFQNNIARKNDVLREIIYNKKYNYLGCFDGNNTGFSWE